MKKLAKIILLLFILISLTQTSAFAGRKLIMGMVQYEGATSKDLSSTYYAYQTAINYLNSYFKANHIDLEIYGKPQFGRYFEIRDWLRKGRIDIAPLPPYAFLSAADRVNIKLLGVLDYPKTWKNILLVRQDSDIRDMNHLINNAGKYEIVYVNELSSSGYIIPKIYFTDMNIRFKKELFSGGHLTTIEKSLKNVYDRNTVLAGDEVFFEDFKKMAPKEAACFRIIFSIENANIFKDCIFASSNIDDRSADLVRESMVLDNVNKVKDPAVREKLKAMAEKVKRYFHLVNFVPNVPDSAFDSLNKYLARYKFAFSERLAIDRVISKIAEDIELRKLKDPAYKPKIALVLPGGGASGSYQAGCIDALDEQLAAFNRNTRQNGKPLSIDLIVGTSVGALNGCLYATGTTEGVNYFWSTISSKDIFTPYWLYQMIMKYQSNTISMLFLTFFALYILLRAALSLFRNRFRGMSMKGVILTIVVIGLSIMVWILMDKEEIPVILFMLILLSLGSELIDHLERYEEQLVAAAKKICGMNEIACGAVIWMLNAALIIFPAAFLGYVFYNPAINNLSFIIMELVLIIFMLLKSLNARKILNFGGSGIYKSIISFTHIILAVALVLALFNVMRYFRTGTAIFNSEGYETMTMHNLNHVLGEDRSDNKEEASRKIIEKKIIKEYVLTASDLKHQQDVYFYYLPKSVPEPYFPLGPHWISLNRHPELLVDALVATGTVLNYFPLKQMTVDNYDMSLLDGGYLHFVPIDAATSLGATHIIILLCSEDTKFDTEPEKWNYFQYISGAREFSTYAGQTLDYFGREKKMSFILAPRVRKIVKQEFDGGYYQGKYVSIKDFMQEGYNDALGQENGFRQLSAGEFILK